MFGYEPELIDCGDACIACYDIGRGRPLVLLHGNGEDSSYWKAQIPEFTRFYRVIAVDSRGHGASENRTRGLSFALMAEDLKSVLDAYFATGITLSRLSSRPVLTGRSLNFY